MNNMETNYFLDNPLFFYKSAFITINLHQSIYYLITLCHRSIDENVRNPPGAKSHITKVYLYTTYIGSTFAAYAQGHIEPLERGLQVQCTNV